MKITDFIPGNQMQYENSDEIAQKILSTINPNNLSPLELWEELTTINKEAVIQWIKNSLTEKFYILYTYYLKKQSHRVFLADRECVIKFIDDNFDEDWGEGIDIMISDINYENVIIGNHDGALVTRLEQYFS